MSRIALLLGLLLVLPACERASESAEADPDAALKPACRVTPAPGVRLTAWEDSLLHLAGRVCNRGDQCVVRCLAEGRGRGIGGGCLHLCQTAEPSSLVLPEPPPLIPADSAGGE